MCLIATRSTDFPGNRRVNWLITLISTADFPVYQVYQTTSNYEGSANLPTSGVDIGSPGVVL
jgi:hypothetical protein